MFCTREPARVRTQPSCFESERSIHYAVDTLATFPNFFCRFPAEIRRTTSCRWRWRRRTRCRRPRTSLRRSRWRRCRRRPSCRRRRWCRSFSSRTSRRRATMTLFRSQTQVSRFDHNKIFLRNCETTYLICIFDAPLMLKFKAILLAFKPGQNLTGCNVLDKL